MNSLSVAKSQGMNQKFKLTPLNAIVPFPLIGSRSKPKNRIEEIALELAGKTGIRRMSEFSGRQAWNSIWKQAIEMLQETQ